MLLVLALLRGRKSRPIRRVLLPPAVTGLGGGDHPSWRRVATPLTRPTRTLGRAALNRALCGLAPSGVYRAAAVTCRAGELLPHPFTLTARPKPGGGLLSVALSRGSPRVAVSHHRALWSPDVPRSGSPLYRSRPADSSAAIMVLAFAERLTFAARLFPTPSGRSSSWAAHGSPLQWPRLARLGPL